MNHVLVILPTYNERENLEALTRRILAAVPEVHILVVDDNSPDGTGDIADRLSEDESHIHALHRPGKGGLGAAYRHGFTWGLEAGFTVLVELDADGSHQPEQLTRLLDRMSTSDVAIGSRWVPGGKVENWPLHRVMLSHAGSLYARIALGLPFRDITGGYRAFTAHALKVIDFASVTSQGYCFQIDMLWRAHLRGLRIAEVPITFVERRFGVSKMSSAIVVEAMIKVTQWGVLGLPKRLRTAKAKPEPIPAENVHAHVG